MGTLENTSSKVVKTTSMTSNLFQKISSLIKKKIVYTTIELLTVPFDY